VSELKYCILSFSLFALRWSKKVVKIFWCFTQSIKKAVNEVAIDKNYLISAGDWLFEIIKV
jgi:hypothetical protein